MKKLLATFVLILSLGICFLLGSRMMQHGDFFYLSDQARDFSLVKSIVIDHKLTLIGSHSGLGGLFHGPLWLYMLVPFFIIGKGNPIIFTYMYLLIPFFTILAGYIVGKKLHGHFFAAIVAFLLGINAVLWSYMQNTIGINLMPLLYILFIYCSVLYMRGSRKALVGAVFLVGFAFQFETASAVALIPVVIMVSFLNKKHKPNLSTIFYSILAFLVSLGTFILFDLRHHFLILTSTLQLFNQHQGHKDYTTLLARITDHLLQMKGTYESALFVPHPLLLLATIALILYFLFTFLKNQDKQKSRLKEFLFYLCTPLFVYVFYLLYPHPIYGEYVLDLTVSLLFAISFILTFLWKEKIGKILVSIYLLMTLFFVISFLRQTYSVAYVPNMTSGSYHNQKNVADWIWQDAKGKSFGYFVYTPETFTYGMDYLFWWESAVHHAMTPVSKKLSITYLILYPPLENDTNAHEFWIKNTIHTTVNAEEIKTFQGGIIVEKIDLGHDTQDVDPNYYQNLIFR